MGREWRFWPAIAVAASLLAGCGGYQPSGGPQRGGTLRMSLDAVPLSLNPLTAGDVSSIRALTPLFPQLYAVGPDLRVHPDLASAMPTVSVDGLTWTVPIRSGARWSDRQSITSADVVYTVATERDPSLTGDAVFDWSMLADVSAPSATTVRFTLRHPLAAFLADRLTLAVVPAHALADTSPAKMADAFFNGTPSVTGGPYLLKGRDRADGTLHLVANPDYYGGRPYIDAIDERVVRDPSTVPAAIAGGDLLWAPGLTPAAAAEGSGLTGVEIHSFPDLGYVALQPNDRAGHPTADVRVRQALAAALDRDAVERAGGGDGAVTLWGDVPHASWAYDAAAAPVLPRRLDTARTRLAEAGYPAAADGRATGAGGALHLGLLVPRGDGARLAAANVIARQLRDAGITVDVTAVDRLTLRSDLVTGAFDLALVERGMGVDPADDDVLGSAAIPTPDGRGGDNTGGYADPTTDSLLSAAQQVTAPPGPALDQARRSTISAVQRRIADQVPFIPLWEPLRWVGWNITVHAVGDAGPNLDQGRNAGMYAAWYLAA